MSTGWDLDTVLDFDVESFSALLEALLRIEYREKIEMAYTLQVATQGTGKDLKKWVGQWKKLLNGGRKKQPKQSKDVGDLGDFLKLVGGGI